MTSSSFTFINHQWLWPVILLSVLLFFIFVWKEYNNKRRILNICVALVAILSLSFLVLKPTIERKSDTSNVAIVTPNYKKVQLDSLKSVYKNLHTVNYKEGRVLFSENSRPTKVFILGQGIASFDMWQLTGISTKFLSGNAPKGIVQLQYTKEPIVGTLIKVNGAYSNAMKGHKLYLQSPAGIAIDSVKLIETNRQEFSLEGEVHVNGQLLYALEEKDSLGNTISNEPLPVNVSNKNKLKILILNGFPTFETKYLKNYLAQLGHELIIRSQLTRGRYKYEYFNTDIKSKPSLRKESLNSFDILITDASSIRNLSNTQLGTIDNLVREEGLGVFIQSDASTKNLRNNLMSFNYVNDASKTFNLNTDNPQISKHNFIFQKDILVEPIHFNNSKIYSAFKLVGNGKIASTVANNTYELKLNGNTNEYQNFWTDIFDIVAKKQPQQISWQNKTQFAVLDQPYQFKMRSTAEKPLVNMDNSIIPLRQNFNIKSVWYGKIYPERLGWRSLHSAQDSSSIFHYYVMDTSKYKALHSYRRTYINKRHFTNFPTETSIFKSSEPINPLWFFIGFLLSMGFLWLEPKI